MIGCHIVEIDTREELDQALEEPVAMVVLLGKQEHLAAVRLEEIASVCKPRGIPIMVDAASEHLERPSPWLRRGADLVVYSGGKFLRGPQTSGLLLGNKQLVQAAWRNASPHQALGRPMKVSKEDIVGVARRARILVRASATDDAERRQMGRRSARRSPSGSRQLAGVARRGSRARAASTACRGSSHLGPRAIPARRAGRCGSAVLDGEPRIMLDDNSRDREFDRDRPVPVAARRGGAGRRRDRRRAARVADQAAPRADPRAGARYRRRLGIARRLSARRAHPPAQPRAAAAANSPAISARRSSRGRSPARSTATAIRFAFNGALRGEHDLAICFEGEVRDGGMSGTVDARRRQRPEPGHRQPQPVRRRPLAGQPSRLRRLRRLGEPAAARG